ncbi:MAG: hypothetical protein AT718_00610 [Vulcanisaeta sp. JCHS_4]|jgi:Formate-dependent nitrite reductase, membrane component|nr:MAG: hypothetical protein AT718_00610 [Vulcanisaeta sp. JCHS_4]
MVTIGFRAQKEWVSERPPAIFVGTLAPAIYIVSLFYGIGIGLLIAWILVVVKLLILYGFTANKAHQEYVVNRWRTSWVSRGAAGLVLFLLFAGLYILGVNVAGIKVITYLPAIQGVLFALSLITAGFIMIYDGFVQAVNKPITFWANGSLPIIFVSEAAFSGILFVDSLVPSLISNNLPYADITLTLLAYSLSLQLWTSNNNDVAGREAVRKLIKGELSGFFWAAVTLLLILPAILTNIAPYYTPIIYIDTALTLIGMYLMIYSIIRVGIYKPLIYPWSYPARV